MTEPKIHDRVQYGMSEVSIVGFSEDDGTRLSNGRWICATSLIPTGEHEWLYTPKPVEDMTVEELVMEHRHSARAVLTNHIGSIMARTLVPEITKLIDRATKEAVEYVMDHHYRTPPRLMGKDAAKKDDAP
jgi:hypothetical protein